MCIARFQYTGRMLRDDYHLPFGINKAKILVLFLFFNAANMVWIAWRCTKPFLFLLLSINYFACLNKWLKYLIPPTSGLLATTRETTYSVRLIIAGLVAGSRPPSSSNIGGPIRPLQTPVYVKFYKINLFICLNYEWSHFSLWVSVLSSLLLPK